MEAKNVSILKIKYNVELFFLRVKSNISNPGFVELGQRLGKEKLFSYIHNFGFGKKTGIDLSGEGSGILFKLDRVGPVELATTSFGQGVSVTPLQQITAVSAAINGGTLYKPYIVKALLEPETKDVIKNIEPTKVRDVISKETSEKVRYALESVVALGTGRNAYIDGYRVGGKTGTAQKVNNGVYMIGNYIVSFIGFLPADNPEVIVYVAVDHPRGITQYGGTVSAPIAKAILEEAIDALDIKKRTDGIKREYRYNEIKYLEVPDVTNLSVTEAKKLLKNFHIEYTGTGDKVITQLPNAGDNILEGSTVRLLLGN